MERMRKNIISRRRGRNLQVESEYMGAIVIIIFINAFVFSLARSVSIVFSLVITFSRIFSLPFCFYVRFNLSGLRGPSLYSANSKSSQPAGRPYLWASLEMRERLGEKNPCGKDLLRFLNTFHFSYVSSSQNPLRKREFQVRKKKNSKAFAITNSQR